MQHKSQKSFDTKGVEDIVRPKYIAPTQPIKRKRIKWKRNWPCVCGSERKYKNCCMGEMQKLDILDGNASVGD